MWIAENWEWIAGFASAVFTAGIFVGKYGSTRKKFSIIFAAIKEMQILIDSHKDDDQRMNMDFSSHRARQEEINKNISETLMEIKNKIDKLLDKMMSI